MAFPKVASATLLLALAIPAITCGASNRAPQEVLLSEENFAGFVERHPDMYHYRLGLRAYNRGKPERAMTHFREAARYADKLSQALIAEMLWQGRDAPQDRAQAYAWMDLAAERGTRRFLSMREHYWETMTEDERARALQHGEQLYAEFGDNVAKPRLETVLRRERKNVTGSRTGYAGNTTVIASPPGTGSLPSPPGQNTPQPMETLPAATFYASVYWEPKLYFAWREQVWERNLPETLTTVGPLEQVDTDAPPKTDKPSQRR